MSVRQEEAIGADLERRVLRTRADGHEHEHPYDYLILACGAGHAYFGHDEWEEHAPGLKTLEQALEIRRRVLSAYERAEVETETPRASARCSPSWWWAAGRPASSWRARSAR